MKLAIQCAFNYTTASLWNLFLLYIPSEALQEYSVKMNYAHISNLYICSLYGLIGKEVNMKNEDWIDKATQDYVKNSPSYHPCTVIATRESFKDGIIYALSHQWVSVADALPDENEEVLCMMKSNGAVVSGFIFKNEKDTPQVATSPDFHFEDYGEYEPTHWMHKPKLNPER